MFLFILVLILVGVAAFFHSRSQRAQAALASAKQQFDREIANCRKEVDTAVAEHHNAYLDAITALENNATQIKNHYEAESRRAIEAVHEQLKHALEELEPLRAYGTLRDAEADVRGVLADALLEAGSLRHEAQVLLEQAREQSLAERQQAQERANEIREQAHSLLSQATADAGRIVAEAEQRALETAGDAYLALRDKKLIEQAATAIRNVVDGYGDRYIIPTHSVLDDLAADFGHTAAGEALRAAREQTRRMVIQGEAAACDYAEANRRCTAIRFVIDAFNGRVDAILSTVKTNNMGTLEQEIRDAFSLVNLNGQAFRNARILPAYLDARLAELRWAVVVQELRIKEREEQRALREQIREEEKAQRDIERALKEAAKEEALIRDAMAKAQAEAERASGAQREKFQAQLDALTQRLAEAEAKNQRALSMAQQTRSGHVYIISNIGSFGEDVFKIGMTRRLDPLDRIKELGDASVPFEFDVHAMIRSDDAPTLERMLHANFDDLRINKVNYRKEFFRLPLERIRAFVADKGLEATFTMTAQAREFRETHALERMSDEERAHYRIPERIPAIAGDFED